MHRALRNMAHRGPDDQGMLRIGSALLGHRRLSILDTSSAGHQPFVDAAGRYTIVFNGEIFNHRALRAEMEAHGERFRSGTDTEVLLRAFALYGPACLQKLNGFFAFAIHDRESDSLFLARDRYGVKPLFWTRQAGCFRFASELRALLDLGVMPLQDHASTRQYLAFTYVPAPWSALEGVAKLLPGHSLLVGGQQVHVERWYDPVAMAGRVAAVPEPAATLFGLVDDAVQLRLVADVPVGTFLSGGVDSSIVSALAAKHHPHLLTFSIGYADDPWFDESRYAEAVARHIGSEHSTFRLSREEMAEDYLRLLAAVDEPFADSSALPAFMLCERTKQKVTVALSGDGADEVFGGYTKHQAELRWRNPGAAERAVRLLAPLWRSLPRSRNGRWSDRFRKYDRFARLADTDAGDRFLQLAAFTPQGMADRLVRDRAEDLSTRSVLLTEALERMPGMNGVLLADVSNTLPNDMLHKVDLTSMAHGLEVRTPFLDHRVVEFAFSLAAGQKLVKGNGKHILRSTFGHLLPPEVMRRRKRGFEMPLEAMLNGPLRSFVDATLPMEALATAGFDPVAVHALLARSRGPRSNGAAVAVHALVVYMVWWRKWACDVPLSE